MAKRLTNEEFLQKLKDNNIVDYVPLEEYKNSETKIKWHCNIHDIDFYQTPARIFQGRGCKKCKNDKISKKATKSNKIFLAQLKKCNPDITPLEEYKGGKIKIKCICKNGHYFMGTPRHLLNGVGCPVCCNRIIISGENSFWDLRPDFRRFFVSKEDIELAKSVALNCSTTKLKLTCPDCGNVEYYTPHSLSNIIYRCSKCTDKITYPNRLLRQIIYEIAKTKEIKNIKFEYSVNIDETIYKYDASFYYNYIHFFVEFDGGYHENSIKGSNVLLQQERDRIKDKYSKDNGIYLIRIKALGWKPKDVRLSFLKSELNDVFDLDSLDWIKCEKNSQTNEVKELCDIIRLNSKKLNAYDLVSITRFSIDNVRTYYKRGIEFGWCREGDLLKEYHLRTPLKILDKDKNIIGYFRGYYDAINFIENKYNIVIKKKEKRTLENVCKKYNYLYKFVKKEEYYSYLKENIILPNKYSLGGETFNNVTNK